MATHTGKGNTKVFLCTGDGYIEPSGVFSYPLRVATLQIEEVGICSFGDIEYDDAVEFQAFCFVGCSNEKTLAE